MKAPNNTRRQRTINVNGRKIKIVSRQKTWCANPAGWDVTVNGTKYFNNLLTRKEAEESVIARWTKEFLPC